MSRLVASETKRSHVNPKKVYVNAGDELKFIKQHDEEFSFVLVVSTQEKIIYQTALIQEVDDNGTPVLALEKQWQENKVAAKKKSNSKTKQSDPSQGSLF